MWMPGAAQRPVVNHGGRRGASTRGVVLHVVEGAASPFGWFNDPSSQVSSHFGVMVDGSIEQYVDSEWQAWAQMAGNAEWISVETVGWADQPMTQAQVAGCAAVVAWAARVHGFPLGLANTPDDRGLGWHGMGGEAWGNHPDCPGALRRAQRSAILAKIATPAAAVTPAGQPPEAVFPLLVRNSPLTSWVFDLQALLNAKAHQGLTLDGVYGPATEAAVVNVEKFFGLAVDGEAGPKVFRTLLEFGP